MKLLEGYKVNIVKRTLWFAFSLVLLLGWANICFADSIQTIQFEGTSYYYDYDETSSTGEWLDSETGWLNGSNISFKSQDMDTNQYWKIIYKHTNNDTQYDGSYLDTGEPCQSITNNKFMTFEMTFAASVYENTYFFVGYGYHSWDRILSKYQKEKYTWSYIPIGLRWEFEINDSLEMAIDSAIMIMMNGKMKADMTGYEDFTVDLGNKPGFKIELPVIYHLNSKWAFTATPWYEYSSIGESNMVIWYYADGTPEGHYVYEPDSTTKQYGINFGVQWRF